MILKIVLLLALLAPSSALNHVVVTGLPQRAPAYAPLPFTVTLSGNPPWTAIIIDVIDDRGATVPFLSFIPTNHTAHFLVFPGYRDITVTLRVKFAAIPDHVAVYRVNIR